MNERPDWQIRVVEERYELSEKLGKLEKFLALGCPAGDQISPEEQALLRKQGEAMERLVRILDRRIALFTK